MTLERLRALFYYKDGELYNRVSRGSVRKNTPAGYIAEDGYKRVCVDGKYHYIHRLVWEYVNERSIPKGLFIDHIDGNRLNNDISNLRLATPQENQRNKTRQKNGTSEYKGVWFDKVKSCWKASIRFGDRRLYIGQFNTEIEAAIAYDELAMEIHGEFAKLNVLDGREVATLVEHNEPQQ